MEPLRVYEYLGLARRQVFEWARGLSAEQYGRSFAMGRGTLGRTLTHILGSEWYYVERMMGREVPPYERWPIREEEPLALAALEAAWSEQGGRTRAAVGSVRDWGAELEYRIVNDNGRPEIITASAGDIFTQLALHEVHHRAQALNMLRQLGVAGVGEVDIDFNAMMYARRPASG